MRSWVMGRGVETFSISRAMALASYTPTQIGSTTLPFRSFKITMGVLVTGSIMSPRIFISTSMALEARGKGKVVGWNVTVRSPGRDGYPVDENEKFFIDGEAVASIEFQGLEDSFGFSWGFPESQSMFPLTGYFPFLKGAAAYRFFIQDAISFEKSLRVAIGFGVNEDPMFRREFSKPGSTLQLATTVYWYQVEPHAPFPAMPAAAERAPAPDDPFWPSKETLPSADELRSRGVKLEMLCGRPGKEVIFAESGYGAGIG